MTLGNVLTTTILVFVLASPIYAEIALTTVGVAATENFDDFTGAGFSATPDLDSGTLDSGVWSVEAGSFDSAADLSRGSSGFGVATGGIYSFDYTGNGQRSLGIQPGGSDFTDGAIILRVANNTGSSLDSFNIEYDLAVFNDQDRANSLDLEASLDGVNFTNVFSFTSPEAANDSTVVTPFFGSNLTFGSSLATGGNLFLRFVGDDISGGGSRDEFAIDNIAVTGFSTTPNPEPTSLILFGVFLSTNLRRRRS